MSRAIRRTGLSRLRVALPPDSYQLELQLDDARLRIPWGGRSPRSLTECGKLFILEELPTGGLVENDPHQFLILLKGGPHGS